MNAIELLHQHSALSVVTTVDLQDKGLVKVPLTHDRAKTQSRCDEASDTT